MLLVPLIAYGIATLPGISANGFVAAFVAGIAYRFARIRKLAEREIYREITSRTPLLLLDDVLSELDPKRQEYVLNRISGGQVFITCCENDRLDRLQAGRLFHIQNGEVLL